MDDKPANKNNRPIVMCFFFIALQIYLIFLAISKCISQ